MGASVTLYSEVDIDENSDNKEGGISGNKTSSATMPSWNVPTINTPALSTSTSGMYDVSWSVPSTAPDGSEYNWNDSTWIKATSATNRFKISDVQQSMTLYYRYKISDYQWINVSASTILPAYQQPLNLTAENYTGAATDNNNADTRITWSVAGSQTNQQIGDEFELQRSTDVGFATFFTVGTVSYNPATLNYELIDRTSEENINQKVYYRVRRTKTSGTWLWAVCATTEIPKSMTHVGIKAGSVTAEIDANNLVTLKWDFDNGNVWSKDSKIVIVRIRTENNLEEKKELEYSDATKTFTEELTMMCKEFKYGVYILPGNTKYPKQNTVDARVIGNPIVPVNFGDVTELQASKGYFSDRVVLTWLLGNGGAETFAVQRREHGSTGNFSQIETKAAFESSKEYKFDDVTGVPGIIYEYRIAAMTSCATGLNTAYSPISIGFRTPTGNFYGRVTYENGQAVEDVVINATTEEVILSKSLDFNSGATASITNTDLLKDSTSSVTLQAWIAPSTTTGTQNIISKQDMYEIGIENDKFYFKAGTASLQTDTVSVSSVLANSDYVHLTGVYNGSSCKIFINGILKANATTSPATIPALV
jgi:hypothetical protein